MKIIKLLTIGIFIIFLFFVGWMNITPGHFQSTCYCSVSYLTEDQSSNLKSGTCTLIGVCVETNFAKLTNNIKATLSKLDFYK